MNNKTRSRGNKANRDKFFSILAESKYLLRHLIPAVQEMPRAERYDGIGAEMKKAAIGIVREFSIAYKCYDPADKKRHIEEMIGNYYVLMALLDIACSQGIIKEKYRLGIAERIVSDWWKYLEWDESRQCVIVRPGYKMKDRLNEKYHLNLTYHDERRNSGAA